MNERRLGYFLIFFVTFLILTASSYFIWVSYYKGDLLVISFAQIGNLKVDDPVKIKGVDVGYVYDISDRNYSVIVVVKTFESLPIYRNYRIITADKGLMGERMIVINPGTPSEPRLAKTDTLKGEFVIGVSEAIGMAYKLHEVVSSYNNLVKRLGSSNNTFADQFKLFFTTFDSLSNSLMVLAEKIDGEFTPKLEAIQYFINETHSFSHTATPLFNAYFLGLENIISRLDSIINKINAILLVVEQYSQTISSKDHLFWSENVVKVNEQLRALNEALVQLRLECIKLRLVF